MKVATWNIRAGGGKRTEAIARVIREENADVLVLTEYRPIPGARLFGLLRDLGYHMAAGAPNGPQNTVCILSRTPLELCRLEPTPRSAHRWVPVAIREFDITLLGVHVPNQFEVWNKREFWECIEEFAGTTAGKRTMIVGDLNTALDEDCEGQKIREAINFKRLTQAGWVDAWRHMNPKAREFSWYSHRQNGFRLDHCLLSPTLSGCVSTARMRHDVRADGLSDHSLLSVCLAL